MTAMPWWFAHMWPAFAVTGFCLLLEMFFAAAELSVISCDRMLLRKDAEANQRAALLLEQFLENKQRFLATTLLGTQMSVIVSTVTMTYALHRIMSPERAELFLLAGLTPLLSMLNSCSSGVTVVNIDNGFGAAYAASQINALCAGEP